MTNSTNSQNYRDNLANKLKQKRSKKTIPLVQKSGTELAKNLLEEEKGTREYQEAKIQKFVDLLNTPEGKLTKKLNKDLAMNLIKFGKGEDVVKNIEKFLPEDHKEIAYYLINANLGKIVLDTIDKFSGFDYQSLLSRLNARLYSADSVKEEFEILEKQFVGIDPTNLALLIIGYIPETIIKNLDKIGVDHEKLISPIIEKGFGYLLVEHLDKLYYYKPSLRYKEYNRIAKEIMKAQNYSGPVPGSNLLVIFKNLDKFENLDNSVIEKLNENIHSTDRFIEIFEHLGSFDKKAQKWFVNYYIEKRKGQTMRPEFLKVILDSDIALNNIHHLGMRTVFRLMVFDYHSNLFKKYMDKIDEISKKI